MTCRKLPSTVYVTCDLNSDDFAGLLAWRELFQAAEDDEQTVGIYKLVEIKRVKKVLRVT